MKIWKVLSVFVLVPVFLLAEPLKLPHVEEFEPVIKAKSQVVLKTEAGHHFNQLSPLSCGEHAELVKKESAALTCRFNKAGTYKAFLAVCDDANKFCIIYRPEFTVGNASASTQSTNTASTTKTTLHHGFKLGNPEKIIVANLTSKKPKPMLLDFFALWCPPCNDLDELVFSTKQFAKETKNFEKVKINVDEEESWKLKERFKILGYPTVIYLNAKGEEVGRSWGTQSPDLMVQWLQKMKHFDSQPISWAAQQSDSESVRRVAQWNFDLENFDEVKSLLGARSEDWAHELYVRAEAQQAANAKNTKVQQQKLEFLLKYFPNDVLYGYWALDLAAIDKKTGEHYLPQAIANIDSWIARPQDLVREDYSAQDLVILKADLFEAYDKKDELKKAQSEAISFLEKALDGGKKISRGRSGILAYYYRETGRVEDAKKIYEALVKENPQEFTFYYRYANALKDLKQYQNALDWLDKGAPYMTEGNSRLQYAWLKGKLLKELGRKDEALQFVEGALAVAKNPEWEKDRSYRLIKDLKELKGELQAPEKKAN